MANNGITSDSKQLKDQVRDFVGAGQDKVNEIKGKVIDAKDKAMERAETMRSDLTSKIKENPLKAVGIAFGIGYFAMRIFRR